MKAEAERGRGAPLEQTRDSDDHRLFAAHAAADMLGIHRSTLYLAVRSGKLTPDVFTPGGHARFSLETLHRFSERLAHSPATGGETHSTHWLGNAIASLSHYHALQPVGEAIVEAALESIPVFDTCLALYYPEGRPREMPQLAAAKGLTRELSTHYHWLRRHPGLEFVTNIGSRLGARLVVSDARAGFADIPEGTLRLLTDAGFRSCVTVPCDYDGATLGYLAGLGRLPCAFTDAELEMMESLADVLTAALRRSRRDEAIRAQVNGMGMLMRCALSAADSDSPENKRLSLRSIFLQSSRAKNVFEWTEGAASATSVPLQVMEALRIAATNATLHQVHWLAEVTPMVAIATPLQSAGASAAVGAYWRKQDMRSGIGTEAALLQAYAQACASVGYP